MGILNPEGYVIEGWHQRLEDAEGIKENLDPEIKQMMCLIERGDVSCISLLLC